ncbi:DUF6912 family protein [Streptomyces hainanensis]|uniref:Uncharacterized protein n=1 Tax=Streptomyces hainanensis TaxID=402648 RepID=A0A4R4T476_9ACTN|nr:hypothetical protein [Streptomyces hainanensis]TDC71771.1 hypothetical protein E1283_23065 [Streptomyces hainanensis]
MRVYLPLTLAGLAELRRAGEAGPAPLAAYAVTPALREWYLSGDQEELEYAAFSRAAQAALRLLAVEPTVARRRVVLAADVPDGVAVADPDRAMDPEALGEVRLTEALPVSWFASVHVDAPDAESEIATAAAALGAADQGDDDARFVVDGAADHELLWYGVQEIDHLL